MIDVLVGAGGPPGKIISGKHRKLLLDLFRRRTDAAAGVFNIHRAAAEKMILGQATTSPLYRQRHQEELTDDTGHSAERGLEKHKL